MTDERSRDVRAYMTRPCENCPYRIDAPRRHWAKAEFEGVLAAEADVLGGLYSCHKQAALAPEQRGLCAGWLLDQKARGVPSIKLRIVLMRNAAARAAYETVSAAGLAMFRTVNAMCRANGVRPKRSDNAKAENRRSV